MTDPTATTSPHDDSTPAASDAAPTGCCGGPAPAGSSSCCVKDADAKAAGGTGCGCATAATTGAPKKGGCC